jgi:hypothetical protein
VKARVELGERRVVRISEQLVAGYQCQGGCMKKPLTSRG